MPFLLVSDLFLLRCACLHVCVNSLQDSLRGHSSEHWAPSFEKGLADLELNKQLRRVGLQAPDTLSLLRSAGTAKAILSCCAFLHSLWGSRSDSRAWWTSTLPTKLNLQPQHFPLPGMC